MYRSIAQCWAVAGPPFLSFHPARSALLLPAGLLLRCVAGEGAGGGLGGAVPGQPGEDFPLLSAPPPTTFSCQDKVEGGYYADTETDCQASNW